LKADMKLPVWLLIVVSTANTVASAIVMWSGGLAEFSDPGLPTRVASIALAMTLLTAVVSTPLSIMLMVRGAGASVAAAAAAVCALLRWFGQPFTLLRHYSHGQQPVDSLRWVSSKLQAACLYRDQRLQRSCGSANCFHLPFDQRIPV
jgi:hypothetical protein